ncbi:uncharacterized protein BX664DRAFT_375126 [Halteromyces radiatus]|uniref:uncharacterized protein n=1 Tax=Halteromyces radiatus TaxID=101107 RepID=UPI00221E80C0|nr:uncharacterized protein BX664DRAFT_375126 [Halteromyces radiatus]KAI8084613.1 hypothetical protein BX664DRAFT_375126 [Halteromyces radiatus]
MVSKSFMILAFLVCAVSSSPVKGKSNDEAIIPDNSDVKRTNGADGEADKGTGIRARQEVGGTPINSTPNIPITGDLSGGLSGSDGGGVTSTLGCMNTLSVECRKQFEKFLDMTPAQLSQRAIEIATFHHNCPYDLIDL